MPAAPVLSALGALQTTLHVDSENINPGEDNAADLSKSLAYEKRRVFSPLEVDAGATIHDILCKRACEREDGIGLKSEAAAAGSKEERSRRRGFLWREPLPRLFLGEGGSMTGAHIDACPQVELAHGLAGTKILGVAVGHASSSSSSSSAALAASARLARAHAPGQAVIIAATAEAAAAAATEVAPTVAASAAGAAAAVAVAKAEAAGSHAADFDVVATRVPVDRPLVEGSGSGTGSGAGSGAGSDAGSDAMNARSRALLADPAMTLCALRPGSIFAFHSGNLHFATNAYSDNSGGGAGLSAALFHGGVTGACLPRLRASAAAEAAVKGDDRVEEGGWAAGSNRLLRASDLAGMLGAL